MWKGVSNFVKHLKKIELNLCKCVKHLDNREFQRYEKKPSNIGLAFFIHFAFRLTKKKRGRLILMC
jgi:hypothetical protein